MRIITLLLIAAAGALIFQISSVHAREPGVGLNFAPGGTVGIPTGITPPPGVYMLENYVYYNADFIDHNGRKVGSLESNSSTVFVEWAWPTEWTEEIGAHGSSYAMMVLSDISTSFAGASSTRSGLQNMLVVPVSLSWNIAPDLFARIGAGAFAPIGKQEGPFGTEGTGVPFWSPTIALATSYLGDGYNITGSALLQFNTENDKSEYTSGTNLVLEMTATKKFGDFAIGPIGYYSKQITDDKYDGMAYSALNNGQPGCNPQICTKPESAAVGFLVDYSFGSSDFPINAKAYVLKDVYARDSTKGVSAWFTLSHSF